jgi:PAS domain S-box-containing protein
MELATSRDCNARIDENAELRAAVVALKAQLAQAERLIDHIPSIVVRFDLELRYRSVNLAIAQIVGAKPDACIGKTNHELGLPVEFAAAWEQALRQVLSSGEPRQVTLACPRPTQTQHYTIDLVPEHMPDGTLVGAICVAHDVSAQVRAEQQLRNEQCLLHSILEQAPISISLKDRQGRFQRVSRALLSSLGLSSIEQLTDVKSANIWPPDISTMLRDDEQQVIATDAALLRELSLPFSDGTRHLLHMHFPLHDADNALSGVGCIAIDVTDRRALETALRRNESQYRIMTQNLPNLALIAFDRDLHYTLAEGPPTALHGYNTPNIIGKTIWEIIPPDRAELLAPFYQAALTGQSQTIELEWEGRIFLNRSAPVQVDGAIVGGLIVREDITERKQAERALHRLNAELEHQVAERTAQLTRAVEQLEQEIAERARTAAELLESQHYLDQITAILPMILCVYDLQTRQVTFANQQLTAALGDPALVGTNLTMEDLMGWMHPDDQAAETTIDYGIASLVDDEVFEYEYRVRDNNGGWRWFTTRSVVFARTPDGEVLQVLVIALDVTPRRRLEEKLRTFNRRLIDVQEAERAHLARELHDEIGQVLTGLNLALEVALRANATTYQSHIRNAQTLINDLTSYVRRHSIELRPSVLDDLGLTEALSWLIGRYADRIGLHITMQQSGLDEVLAPEIALTAYRVVQEALTNIARHAGVATATLQVWTSNDVLHIQVADQGYGFDVEAVMEGNYSTGLPGMHERVQLLNGKLTIESAPTEGTRVLAELPLQRFDPGMAER